MPTYCVPNLSSLPGSPASDFDWWSAAPDTALMRYYPDNPNWLGALALSENNGGDRDVLFRALKGNLGGKNYLLMQWVARVSDNSTMIDRVNCLIGVPGGPYLAFNARFSSAAPNQVCKSNDDLGFSYRILSCTVDPMTHLISTTGAADTTTGDLEDTGRMWVGVTTPNRGIQSSWAFQLAIPLGGPWGGKMGTPLTPINLPVAGTIRMWFEILTHPYGMVPYAFPRINGGTHSYAEIIPDPAIGMGSVKLNEQTDLLELSTAGGGCVSGVTLSSANVGTHDPDGKVRANPYVVHLDLGKTYPPNTGGYIQNYKPDLNGANHSNLFFAKPTFPVGFTPAQKNSIRATFSLANWGSQFSEVIPGQTWRPIISLESYHDVNGEAHHAWPVAGVMDDENLAKAMVDNINTYLNAEFAGNPAPAGSQLPHQCMLVELTSDDPTLVISPSSIYANMNIVRASTYRRFAEISVVGAPPISAKPRDVYLYVKKYNMPAVVQPGTKPPGIFNRDMQTNLAAATTPPLPRDVEDLAAMAPTWTIHAYIETGKFYQLEDGTKVPIMRPQTAFGYYVAHEGDLYGWETRLYGAEKLSDHLYVMRVPNNGVAHVETVVQARANASEAPLPAEPKPKKPGCPLGCLGSLLTLFGLSRE